MNLNPKKAVGKSELTAILQKGGPASCVSSIGIELQILEDVHFMFTRAVSMSSFSLVFAYFVQTIFLWRDLGIAGLAQLGKNLSALNALQPPVLLGTQRTLPTKATLMKSENITNSFKRVAPTFCNSFCWSKKRIVFTIVHQQNQWKLKISSIAIVWASLHK